MSFLAGFTKIRNSNLLDSRCGAEVIFCSLSASIQRLTNISAPPRTPEKSISLLSFKTMEFNKISKVSSLLTKKEKSVRFLL
jgi:hypothetical protein